jgi:hypothetical protein
MNTSSLTVGRARTWTWVAQLHSWLDNHPMTLPEVASTRSATTALPLATEDISAEPIIQELGWSQVTPELPSLYEREHGGGTVHRLVLSYGQ